ncbi:glycosyltransferase [Arcobacter sp. FWKO B]|uniref:glycosyltransferase n=1 Tax=Arcobacter sp. FWKO B TaxID=2593672 RepID=UPI0018A694C9|nr:glycosyltransferase [Arcobacter sp. FWKO B]QOG12073.1 glycosyltransferase [Arcobacter sp. FWKO B]
MRILQLGRFYPPSIGGIETVMYDITEGLNNYKDVSCDVLCSSKNYTYEENIYDKYKVIRTKSYGIYFSTSITPQMIFKLKKIIKEYDILHIHLPDPMANIVLMFVDSSKQKIVLHWHSDIVKQKYLLKIYEPFQDWMMKKANKIIATTPKYIYESKYLQKYKDKCVSIPIGIDKNKLSIDVHEVNSIREKYKNKKIIFSLGRLVYYKGFEYLIEAAKYLSEEYIILIGGTGPLHAKLVHKIKLYNLENKVKLLGRIDDKELGNYYAACDIYCLSSVEKSEAFAIVQIEAMSFSKPIVATQIKGSGVDWVNKHHESGINVLPKNGKELAEAIMKVTLDKELYSKYSQGAKNRFEEYFHRKTMVESIYKLYNELLK